MGQCGIHSAECCVSLIQIPRDELDMSISFQIIWKVPVAVLTHCFSFYKIDWLACSPGVSTVYEKVVLFIGFSEDATLLFFSLFQMLHYLSQSEDNVLDQPGERTSGIEK